MERRDFVAAREQTAERKGWPRASSFRLGAEAGQLLKLLTNRIAAAMSLSSNRDSALPLVPRILSKKNK
jgi:hypothetical protein